MNLTIKLFATFREGRFEIARQEHPEDATVGSIADGLGIPRAQIGVVLVSGRHAALEHRPVTGDTVAIFPLLGGG